MASLKGARYPIRDSVLALRRQCPDLTRAEIAAKIGKSSGYVRATLRRAGYVKSADEYRLAELAREAKSLTTQIKTARARIASMIERRADVGFELSTVRARVRDAARKAGK